MTRIKLLIPLLLFSIMATAQELNAKVTVAANQVGNNVNKNVFRTLQTSLNNFLNNRKWTADQYGTNERIDCNFFLNVESTDEQNVYKGTLSIQSARPVFNSSYLSPIINFKDDNLLFRYQEFQQLEFNESRVSGSDPLVSNLSAIFAYYAYVIIGFDAASFSQHGGNAAFLKAQNIIDNAPDGNNISGWKAFDGLRNRYWLIGNMLNSRNDIVHEIYYNYYRQALDNLYQDEKLARTNLLIALTQMDAFNKENPGTMINQFFFQGKTNEIIQILSKASPQDKATARDILSRVDINNASRYKDELK